MASDFDRIVKAIACQGTGCFGGGKVPGFVTDEGWQRGVHPCEVCGGTGLDPDVQVEFDINPWWNVVIAWAKSEGRSLTENHL